jgi:DNA-binding NtrC family response regulator
MASLLIVDDDETIRGTLYELFCDEHLCDAVASVEAALALIEHRTYDVVLTDITLPGLSGVEFLDLLGRHQPGTPVILISGIGYEPHAHGASTRGAFDYLTKPFHLEDVEASVARALQRGRLSCGK